MIQWFYLGSLWSMNFLNKSLTGALEKANKAPLAVLIFFVFLTISLFLGDGKQPFVDVFMALGILLSFGALFYQKTRLRPLPGKVAVLWFVVIAYCFVRTLYSDSPGYSVSATIRLIEAFLVYEIFYSVSSEKTLIVFIRFAIFLAGVAQTFALLFMIFPAWARFLPLMNLLYANYGHNHLADLLLIAVPVVFFRWFNKPRRFNFVLLAFYAFGMILTFARGAWLLLLLFFCFQLLRLKENKSVPTNLKILVISLIVFFSFISVSSSLLALSKNPEQRFAVGLLAKQLIKPPLWQDPRIKYWKQAVAAVIERPWFGSGPGTFYLQSIRLQDAPLSYSWFAHSFPLQSVVELGVAGSAPTFVLFVILLWPLVLIILNKREDGGRQALAWGAVLTFCYSLFEFNLDYSVIWLVFWLVAGVLSGENQKKPQVSIKMARPQTAFVFFAAFVLSIYYFVSTTSVVAQAYINKPGAALIVAPFNEATAEKYLGFLKENKLEIEQQEKDFINAFHKNNPAIYPYLIDLAKTEPEKQRLRERLVSLDPWKRNEYDLAKYYLETGNLGPAQKQIEKTRLLWLDAEKKLKRKFWYAETPTLLMQMLALGDSYYKNGKPEEAGGWYRKAQDMDTWALHKHRPVFMDYPLPDTEKAKFFLGLGSVSGEHLGKYVNDYANEYLRALLGVVQAPISPNYSMLALQVLRIAPWARFSAWDSIGSALLKKAERETMFNQQEKALATLFDGVSFWKALTKDGEQLNWELQRKFAEELVSVGNLLAPNNLSLTGSAYKAATTLVPGVINNTNSWFMQYGPRDIQYSSLIYYINQKTNIDEKSPRYLTEATLMLIEKYLTDDQPQKAAETTERHKDLSSADYDRRKTLVRKLQKKADEYVKTGRQKEAEATILVLSRVLPENYWVSVQPGNYYLSVGDFVKAKQEFNTCLTRFNGKHDDCQNGLKKAENGEAGGGEYWRAAQIIQLGTK